MKALIRFVCAAAMVGAMACADNAGDVCSSDDDCGGRKICALLSPCDGDDCFGTCRPSCESTDECADEEMCVTDRVGRLHCRPSPVRD